MWKDAKEEDKTNCIVSHPTLFRKVSLLQNLISSAVCYCSQVLKFYSFDSWFSVKDKEKLQALQQSHSCAGSLIQWTDSHVYTTSANRTRG
jgi:hypothetical protein